MILASFLSLFPSLPLFPPRRYVSSFRILAHDFLSAMSATFLFSLFSVYFHLTIVRTYIR